MGLHLTPNHFYIPIPDTRKLKMDLWKEQSDLDGIDINEEEQNQTARGHPTLKGWGMLRAARFG